MATLVVRNVNKKIIQEFKAKAAKEEMNMGEAITMAMVQWKRKQKKKLSLLDFPSVDFGDPYASQNIDEILYGGENDRSH